MKLVIFLLFSLVVLAVASESVEENINDDLPEQQRACADLKEKCTEGDDCSCCGDRGKCDCNWPGKPGCYCMRGGPLDAIAKKFKC
uniref:U34-Lycotoxin-Lsp1c_1 n=1 Tax=Lycosa sp. SGP-2016 TaxID=1905177 RepID=A0A482Z852_9ARAC